MVGIFQLWDWFDKKYQVCTVVISTEALPGLITWPHKVDPSFQLDNFITLSLVSWYMIFYRHEHPDEDLPDLQLLISLAVCKRHPENLNKSNPLGAQTCCTCRPVTSRISAPLCSALLPLQHQLPSSLSPLVFVSIFLLGITTSIPVSSPCDSRGTLISLELQASSLKASWCTALISMVRVVVTLLLHEWHVLNISKGYIFILYSIN